MIFVRQKNIYPMHFKNVQENIKKIKGFIFIVIKFKNSIELYYYF